MSQRQKKSICFLLMISMLMLGMCFERIGADSPFVCASAGTADGEGAVCDTILHGVGSTPLCEQVYLKDTFDTQEVAAVIRHSARKWGNRFQRGGSSFVLQSAAAVVWLSDEGFGAAFGTESVPGICRNIMIVNYIHQKDGKKAGISSFFPDMSM